MSRTLKKANMMFQARRISLVRASPYVRYFTFTRLIFFLPLDISELEWHTLSKEDLCVRCGVSDKVGLDVVMAARRLASNGRNVISPPPRNYIKMILGYIFGGMAFH